MATKGYTLIEMILSLFMVSLICLSVSVFYKGFNKLKIENHSDLVYCITSLTEEMNTALNVEITDSSLICTTSDETYTYYLNKNRLVKSPGFDIYLHDIDDIYFYKSNDYIMMEITRNDKKESYILGTYFRPNKRNCEPSSDDLTFEFDKH